MAQLNWDDLRLFAEVARMGSFRRAARTLKITEPTVSRRLRRLEATLGLTLFRFAAGTTLLTEDGQRVLSHAQSAEHAIAQLAGPVVPKKKMSGHCIILAGDGIAAYWLPQFLTAFLDVHDRVQVSVIASRERYGQKPLFDLRIQYGASLPDDMVCVPLAMVHFVLFGSQRYVQTHGAPDSLEDLTNHRLIDLVDEANRQGTIASWLGIDLPPAFVSNSNGTLAEMVRNGAGIGFLPTYAALMDEDAVPILPEHRFRLPLYLAYERSVGKKPHVRAMIDYLRNVIFERAAMPWFADEFAPPMPLWKPIYERLLREAARKLATPKKNSSR